MPPLRGGLTLREVSHSEIRFYGTGIGIIDNFLSQYKFKGESESELTAGVRAKTG